MWLTAGNSYETLPRTDSNDIPSEPDEEVHGTAAGRVFFSRHSEVIPDARQCLRLPAIGSQVASAWGETCCRLISRSQGRISCKVALMVGAAAVCTILVTLGKHPLFTRLIGTATGLVDGLARENQVRPATETTIGSRLSDQSSADCSLHRCGGYCASTPCQCNERCKQHGDCCWNYQMICTVLGNTSLLSSPVVSVQNTLRIEVVKEAMAAQSSKIFEEQASADALMAGLIGHSCATFGCSAAYVAGQSCQCNVACSRFGNCCLDYRRVCVTSTTTSTVTSSSTTMTATSSTRTTTTTTRLGCGHYECVPYDAAHECQCNLGCAAHGTCCWDYQHVCAGKEISIEQVAKDVFPGELYHWFQKFDPLFIGYPLVGPVDCLHPAPYIYFSNPRDGSWPLFHNKMKNFPMAMNYMDSSYWGRPSEGHFQTVLGFADMQWPYYQYLGNMNPEAPYLVISMGTEYSPRLNFQFVECGLLGWPGFPMFQPGEWPIRLVLKNAHAGRTCGPDESGHAWCNLATSWGGSPSLNNWRPTAMEVNALIKLCTMKYQCDVVKANLPAPDGKEAPQVFMFKVKRDAGGAIIPPLEKLNPLT